MSDLYVQWNSLRCGSLADVPVIRAPWSFDGHFRNEGLRRRRAARLGRSGGSGRRPTCCFPKFEAAVTPLDNQ